MISMGQYHLRKVCFRIACFLVANVHKTNLELSHQAPTMLTSKSKRIKVLLAVIWRTTSFSSKIFSRSLYCTKKKKKVFTHTIVIVKSTAFYSRYKKELLYFEDLRVNCRSDFMVPLSLSSQVPGRLYMISGLTVCGKVVVSDFHNKSDLAPLGSEQRM